MIRGERVIQINMALLILMGSLLLSIAQDDNRVLVITAVGVTFTLLIVDWFRWISFHPILVNALAFTVSFFSFAQFAGGNTGTKLNAVANLLTYLQLVLLLQRKSPRLYWQIMMLSLLQVVVAAALNLDFSAGLVFFGYIILVVIGTIHLKIYRGNFRLAEQEKANDEQLESIRLDASQTSVGVATFRASEIEFRSEKKITIQGLVLCLGALLFAFTVFYSIPRFGSAWHGPDGSQRQQTGFAKEIRFDDDGFLQNSNRNVFRASFLDESDNPVELAIEPYFKGLLLKDYQPIDGSFVWSNPDNEKPTRIGQGAYFLQDSTIEDIKYVRQVIRLEPAGKVRLQQEEANHLLFSVFPVYQSENTPADLVYHKRWEILFRDSTLSTHSENAPYTYEVKVPLYRSLGQLPATPLNSLSPLQVVHLDSELKQLVGNDFDLFDQDWKPIKLLADAIVEQMDEKNNRRMICNRFVNFLKRPEFKYTRDLGSIERTPEADPIVEFLCNHKKGHCEYFATGLALMLRSQGIPCRIVTGFHGGDYNELGGFYQVKEKHAHVWVEAYLPPGECDNDMKKSGQSSFMGAWLRLDPTPSSDDDSSVAANSLLDRAFDAVGIAQKIWDDYVTGLEQESRTKNGFDPTDADSDFSLSLVAYFKDNYERLVESIRAIPKSYWIALLAILFILLVLIMFFRTRARLRLQGEETTVAKVLSSWVENSISSARKISSAVLVGTQETRTQQDYFREFEQLMESAGFVRKPSETPLEFSEKVVRGLVTDHPEQSEIIRTTIQSTIESFYSLRFSMDADDETLVQFESDLNKLRQVLNA